MMPEQNRSGEQAALLIPSQVHQEREMLLRPSLDQVLIVLMLLLIAAVRLLNLNYNTLFVDEASYLRVGRDLLLGRFDTQALTWLSGSPLYPLLAAITERLGGIGWLRGLSVLLSTATCGLVFLISLRLFDQAAALWASFIFGLSGVSIFVGQFAVLEALATPLLAAAVLLVLISVHTTDRTAHTALVGASLAFALAVLVKYVLLIYLPALLLIFVLLNLAAQRPIHWRPAALLLGPAVLLIGSYGLANFAELRTLLLGSATFQAGSSAEILQAIWDELGFVLILAAAGAVVFLFRFLRSAQASQRQRLLWLGLCLLLGLAMLALPFYHLLSGNARSAGKHTIYSLFWLAPLAGLICAQLVAGVRRLAGIAGGALQFAGGVLGIAITLLLFDQALDRTWSWQHSWPRVTDTLAALEQARLDDGARILAEASDIYVYHFQGRGQPQIDWFNTWVFAYDHKQGLEALQTAIHDRYFAAVVLDDYYTPGVRAQLLAALEAAGYRQVFAHTQQLSSGAQILTTIYLHPEPASRVTDQTGGAAALRHMGQVHAPQLMRPFPSISQVNE